MNTLWEEALAEEGLTGDSAPVSEPDPWEGDAEVAPAALIQRALSEAETAPEPADAGIDSQLSEAEARLSKAMYYRQFLTNPIFDSPDQIGSEVEAEFRDFAKTRLGVLLGIEAPKPAAEPPLFSPEEAVVLKQLVGKLLTNAKLRAASLEQPAKPQQAAAAPKPAAKPQPAPKPPAPKPSAPKLKSRPSPEGVQPAPARGFTPPSRPAVPTPARFAAKDGPPPQDGSLITEGTRTYRIKWTEMSPDEFGPSAAARLDAAEPGVLRERGLQIIKTEGGEYFKVIRQDLTPQVRSTTAVPFPSDSGQMAAVMAMKSAEAVQNQSAAVKRVGEAAISEGN